MPRLRYNLAEARDAAIRLAAAYVAKLPGANKIEFSDASASPMAPHSNSSKHPVIWSVCYRPIRSNPNVVVDGGELLLNVDIEAKTVRPASPD